MTCKYLNARLETTDAGGRVASDRHQPGRPADIGADDDEAAKRFDLMLLGLQLRRLRPEPGEERLRRQVQEIAGGLFEQTAIPAIREQQGLLEDLAGDEWWVDVTLPMLERALSTTSLRTGS